MNIMFLNIIFNQKIKIFDLRFSKLVTLMDIY